MFHHTSISLLLPHPRSDMPQQVDRCLALRRLHLAGLPASFKLPQDTIVLEHELIFAWHLHKVRLGCFADLIQQAIAFCSSTIPLQPVAMRCSSFSMALRSRETCAVRSISSALALASGLTLGTNAAHASR